MNYLLHNCRTPTPSIPLVSCLFFVFSSSFRKIKLPHLLLLVSYRQLVRIHRVGTETTAAAAGGGMEGGRAGGRAGEEEEYWKKEGTEAETTVFPSSSSSASTTT